MDWSKAKNILIMAFIVTNLFLAYVLFLTDKEDDEVTVKDELIVDVVNLLEKEGIKVDTEIPTLVPKLPVISLEYEIYNPVEIIPRFLKNYKEEQMENETVYTDGDKSLRFKENNKKIVYENKDLRNNKETSKISLERATEISRNFMSEHGFDLKDVGLISHTEQGDIYKLEYRKVIEDIVVEETKMTIEVSSKGVILFERRWTEDVKRGRENLLTSSAPKALLRLLTREEYYGRTIKEIDIRYYFNVDEYKKSISFKDSTGGVATPTWRFIFEDGEELYLEED